MRNFFLIAFASLISSHVAGQSQIGIIGGQDGSGLSPAYAAFVAEDGTLTQISGPGFPINNGIINSVSINAFGVALIGGNDADAYASLVAPDGTLTQVSGGGFPLLGGVIRSVAINNSTVGLIGGFNGTVPYAALVAPNGTLTQLSGGGFPATGYIQDVAINNSGVGLIGGHQGVGAGPAYAASVAPNGTVTQLSGGGLPPNGLIRTVAINRSGAGLIGGENNGSSTAYAALVAPNGALTQLSGGILPFSGFIQSVAINDAGVGLIGGDQTAGVAYAAFVSPDGMVTQIMGLPTNMGSSVNSVAINNSGAGILGGHVGVTTAAYAALVAPNGTINMLSGGNLPSTSGEINTVSINDAGVGLIGGFNNLGSQPAYAALVAPNGTLTELTGGNFPFITGTIDTSAFIPILENVIPKSIGPYFSAIFTQLAASNALEGHITTQSKRWDREEIETQNNTAALLTDAGDLVAIGDPSCEIESPNCKLYSNPCQDELPTYSLWTAPFGDFVHQKHQENIPTFTNEIAGAIAGFDYRNSDLLLGGGLGYALNYLHISQNQGHGTIQEEMAFLYGAITKKAIRFNAVLWGGLYQFHNERHTLSLITSKAHIHGWILSPHIEMAVPIEVKKSFSIEPFLLFDWVNSWQNPFTEKGSSGLNIVMKSQYVSLLRSEVGLRFYEIFYHCWGKFLLEEKASYVNLAPFHFNSRDVFFVGSASTFPIAIGSTKTQNLGGVELRAAFFPNNLKYPYGVLAFQGEFGSSFQSYFASIEVGKYF